MKKLIYLEDAIDALEKWESESTWDEWCYDHKDEAEKYNIISPSSVVFNLPSAQRKKGKWIRHPEWEADGECGYECDQCGMGSDVDYNFCMRCGAKMEV